MEGLTDVQTEQAYKIASYLCYQTKAGAAKVSPISFELCRAIGKVRFAKAIMFYLRRINASCAANTAGPRLFASAIDKNHQSCFDALHERLVRDLVKPVFYDEIEKILSPDEIAYACLFSGDEKARFEELQIQLATPDQPTLNRRFARLKNNTLTTRRALDGQSDSDDEHDQREVPIVLRPVRRRRERSRSPSPPPAPVKKSRPARPVAKAINYADDEDDFDDVEIFDDEDEDDQEEEDDSFIDLLSDE